MRTDESTQYVSVVGQQELGELPNDCRRAMEMLARMSEEPLSHDELGDFTMHMAMCSACSMVASKLHAMRAEEAEREVGKPVTELSQQPG